MLSKERLSKKKVRSQHKNFKHQKKKFNFLMMTAQPHIKLFKRGTRYLPQSDLTEIFSTRKLAN